MSAIWERELKLLINKKRFYLLGGLFLFLHGLFMTLYHFYMGRTRYEVILGSVAVFVAYLLPFWTVARFSKQKSGEEDRFLQMLPLTSRDILFGKLLSGVTLLGGVFAVLGISPLVLYFFGGTNLLSAYAALLVGFFLCLAILLGLSLIALSCRRRLVAYAVSYGALVLLFALAKIAAAVSGPLSSVLGYLSLFGAIEPLSLPLFDWRVLLWYLAVSLLLFGILFKKMGGSLGRSALSLALAVLLVAGTVLGAFLPVYGTELDLSSEKMMSISNGTRGFLSSLDEDVTLYVLDQDAENAETYRDARFEAYLRKYASYSKHVHLERLPISQSGALLAELGMTAADVYQYCIIVKGEKRTQILDYMSMIIYSHNHATLTALGIPTEMSVSNYEYYYSAIESAAASDYSTYGEAYVAFMENVMLYFKGERYFNAAIEYVVSDLIPQKYALSGHGEKPLSSVALGELMADCLPLTLGEGETVPADVSALTILAPTSDFSAETVRSLSDYLNRGGTVILITGESNLEMPNLTGMLSSFGLSAKRGAVGEDETVTVKDDEGNETEKVERTYSVHATVNTDHDVLAGIASLGESALSPRITNGNSISFHTTDDASLLTTALLTTSKNAFVGENDGEKGAHVLAAVAENNRGARLVWFTGADGFVKSSAEVREDMSYVYALACPYLAAEWTSLVYQSALVPAPATLYEEAYLRATDLHMTVFAILSMIVLPGALIGVGMIRITKRKKA